MIMAASFIIMRLVKSIWRMVWWGINGVEFQRVGAGEIIHIVPPASWNNSGHAISETNSVGRLVFITGMNKQHSCTVLNSEKLVHLSVFLPS